MISTSVHATATVAVRAGCPGCAETVTCRVFPTTHAGRAVDLDLALTPLVDNLRLGPTVEKEKGYGGLTFRYAQAGQQLIVADNKRVPRDGTQVRAAWADFSGIFMRLPGQPNKERTGAAVFVDTTPGLRQPRCGTAPPS